MATPGSAKQARVRRGLARVGQRVGSGSAYICTLRKEVADESDGSGYEVPPGMGGTSTTPAAPTYTYSALTAVDDLREIRDASGTLTGQTRRTLTVDATGAEPKKADKIAVGVAVADVDADTIWHTITEVRPLSPGGVVLLYELDIARS